MSAPAAAAAGAAALGAPSPGSQSQQASQSWSDLHNRSPRSIALANRADMPQPSLTQPIALAPDATSAHQQFLAAPAVQHRLAAACDRFNTAADQLQKATLARDRFIAAATKQGGAKQLPVSLRWKLSESIKLGQQSVPDGLYADDLAQLRAIEQDATDKAYDVILSARDKHLAHLKSQCNMRDFISSEAQSFQPVLEAQAREFNALINIDEFAASQASFSFPTAAVAAHFASELQRMLQAQTLAKVDASQQQQQLALQRQAEEYKAQEVVLAGAHTGETIAKLAQQQVDKAVTPIMKQLQQIQKQLQQSGRKRPAEGEHPLQPRSQHARASSPPAPSSSRHRRDDSRDSDRKVTFKLAASKRAREPPIDVDADDEDRAVHTSSPAHRDPRAARKHLLVTLKPKNGAGGDRHPRSDPQQPRSSEPAHAPRHNNARQHGRGPRSDAPQPQPRK